MKLLAYRKTILLAILLVAFLAFTPFAIYENLPKDSKYEVQDWFTRLTAKNFHLPPDDFRPQDQDEIINEYKRRGFEMKCYGGLRPEEITVPGEDFQCWFIIKSAFNNIPAKMVRLNFGKKTLSSVNITFPDSSFEELEKYLERRMKRYLKREDDISVDIFGKPIVSWDAKHGTVTTSAEPTENQDITLFWSRYKAQAEETNSGR
ncbi:hypothetical protein [Chitinolyticbacter albus]|uniref:hypothetical protein n=1 Tax=Chitinolyticbacter albus TaxID=2961951 RepID=UPI00210E015D|nr:hypothetical protein [Chitinolyticbacter albus]